MPKPPRAKPPGGHPVCENCKAPHNCRVRNFHLARQEIADAHERGISSLPSDWPYCVHYRCPLGTGTAKSVIKQAARPDSMLTWREAEIIHPGTGTVSLPVIRVDTNEKEGLIAYTPHGLEFVSEIKRPDGSVTRQLTGQILRDPNNRHKKNAEKGLRKSGLGHYLP